MQKRYLIADQEIIEQLKTQLELIDSDNDNWTETYLDKETGDKWFYYRVDSSYHGGGYPVIGRIPIPDTSELIEIAINSNYNDEIFAACRTLVENEEIKKKEFRLRLIDNLEKLNNRQRQKRIIDLTGLNSTLNRREIVGRTIDEISSDIQYYKNIADRADKLIK